MRKYLAGIFLLLLAIIIFVFFASNNTKQNLFSQNQPSKGTLHSSNIDSLIYVELAKSFQLGRHEWKYKEAISLVNSLLNNPNFKFAQDTSKAYTYHRKGAYEQMLGNFKSSNEYINNAIQLRNNIENFPDSILAESYFIRARTNLDLVKTENALKDIKESIRLVENNDNAEYLNLKFYSFASKVFLTIGDQESHKIYFEEIISKYNNNTIPKNSKYSGLYVDIAHYYENKRDFKKALNAYLIADSIFIQLNQIPQQAEIKLNIGNTYYRQKKYKIARAAYLKNLAFINVNKNNTFDLSNIKRITLKNLVNVVYRDDKDLNACQDYAQQAIDAAKVSNSNHGVALGLSQNTLGDVLSEKKLHTEAIREYHNGIKSICVGFNSTDIFATPSIANNQILSVNSLRKILRNKLKSLNAFYNINNNPETLESIYHHQLTLDSINLQIRQNYDSGSARFNFVARILPEYEQAIETMLELNQIKKDPAYLEEAYKFAAKNKAIVMLDGLQDESAKFAGLPESLLTEEKELKSKYFKLESKLYDLKQGDKEEQIKETKEERFKLRRQYQQMIDQFEKKYPSYFQLKYAFQKQLNSADLVNQLPDEAAIIEYFVGKDNIYAFVISKAGGLQSYVKVKPKNFAALCTSFMAAVENKESSLNEFSEKSNELYTLLLKDELEALKKTDDISRLIIVPDGELLQVSFDALFDQKVNTDQTWASGNLPYLLNNYAISYAYSNQLIFEDKKTANVKKNLQPYTGFGLEYTDSITLQGMNDLTDVKVDTVLSRGMGKLFYSDDEVKEIAEITGGKAFVNDAALKSSFFKESSNSKVIHLAMHGFVVEDQPLNSGLIFKRKDLNDDDYVLKAGDLYAHPLQAKLAVLSACHTGSGILQKGEGVRSLARAFHYAGCHSVVASLWSAPDFSTKDIMVQYFTLLKSGLPKDVALQQAKLSFFQNTSDAFAHPNYWTHLISIGDNQSISF